MIILSGRTWSQMKLDTDIGAWSYNVFFRRDFISHFLYIKTSLCSGHRYSPMIDRLIFYWAYFKISGRLINMKHFHAHLYFEAKDVEGARNCMREAGSLGLFTLVKFHEQPIGPHPTATIELHFTETVYASALEWLQENRRDFSVLVHQDTGDDFEDHTANIQWFGKEVPLNFEFFKLIQSRPDLRINQPRAEVRSDVES